MIHQGAPSGTKLPSGVLDKAGTPVNEKESAPLLNLRLLSLAGEEFASLSNARNDWTYKDLANSVAAQVPLQGEMQTYKFLRADKIIQRGVPLSEYGLGSENENNEITVCVTRDDALVELETQAKPRLEAASNAVRSLNRSCFIELSGLSNPPEKVLLAVEAVYSLLGRQTNFKCSSVIHVRSTVGWQEWKTVLADLADEAKRHEMLQRFENFEDVQNLDEIVQRLNKFVEDPDFNPERGRVAIKYKLPGLICEKMCAWVHAVHACARIAKEL